jgi:hypothetical protein
MRDPWGALEPRELPVDLASPDDEAAALEVALIGSMAREEREELNPVKQARAVATLKNELGLTLQELGE